MNLWILSQNREDLVRAEHLGIYNKKIYVNGYSENGYCVGEYKTRKRALEVLAEINSIKWWKYMADLNFELFIKIIKENHSEDEINEIFKLMNTYEMPSE